MTLNHPEIRRKLTSDFIPTVAPSTDPSFSDSEAGKWFFRMADTNKESGGHYQGFYIVNADGIGPTRHFDPIGHYPTGPLLKFMDDAYRVVRAKPVSKTEISESQLSLPPMARPDPSTSVLRIVNRIVGAPADPHLLNNAPDRDFIWVLREEVKEIVQLARQGGEFALPRPMVGRLVRYHLVDNLGGRTQFFMGAREVKRADFRARVLRVGPRFLELSLNGTYASTQEKNAFGIEGEIQGELRIDTQTLRITRLRAFATSQAWGGPVNGAETPPPGKFKIIHALTEADDVIARNVPPAYGYSTTYLDAGYRSLPKYTP